MLRGAAVVRPAKVCVHVYVHVCVCVFDSPARPYDFRGQTRPVNTAEA
jgi:hypothetical protein